MPFRNQQQVARIRADSIDRSLCRLHRRRQHLLRQVVEPAREQIHVDRRKLEAGVAQIDRAVKRRRVVLPLQPEPALNGRQRLQNALLELQQRPGLRGQ